MSRVSASEVGPNSAPYVQGCCHRLNHTLEHSWCKAWLFLALWYQEAVDYIGNIEKAIAKAEAYLQAAQQSMWTPTAKP